ncbi:putative metalloprotease 1 precursor [Diplodia seriata]|uniref:Putative metalloprotease 1 n=1 Tax=Diplodia seriata TaxID=420778 RepID=A0A0G2E8P6_9PEZI|nr:putative metalloprotease 1 precursor [Diplodia seriata]
MMLADYFHGTDGLGGIHSSHPHLTPEETWKSLFASALSSSDAETIAAVREAQQPNALFAPSAQRSHLEILRLLRENEPNTISIIAVGPLTNCALAAATDPETFLRAKEVVVMGGTIAETGNVTPVAEFNTYADSIAAARVYALTSALPESTMPPIPPTPPGKENEHLKPYPKNLNKKLKVALFPLDITHKHELTRGQFDAAIAANHAAGSPLATWASVFISSTFRKVEGLSSSERDTVAETVSFSLHDPLCVWYAMTPDDPRWKWASGREDREGVPGEEDGYEDIRVETSGQWTRGMCVEEKQATESGDFSHIRYFGGRLQLPAMQFKISFVAVMMAATAMARDRCAAPEPSEELLEVSRDMGLREAAAREAGISARQSGSITVDTWFHVVAASNSVANGYITDAMLADQLDVLNAHYAPHGISFTHAGTTRTINRSWADDGNELAMKRELRRGDYKTLNIYFQRTLDQEALGYAYFPTSAAEGSTDYYLDGASIMAQSVPGGSEAPYNLGGTATHEVGHWLGLYHTFQGGCSGAGDSIADTPAQSGWETGCPTTRDSCPSDSGLDPVHNYMGYSDDACYTEFTPNQETRIYSMWEQYRA